MLTTSGEGGPFILNFRFVWPLPYLPSLAIKKNNNDVMPLYARNPAFNQLPGKKYFDRSGLNLSNLSLVPVECERGRIYD